MLNMHEDNYKKEFYDQLKREASENYSKQITAYKIIDLLIKNIEIYEPFILALQNMNESFDEKPTLESLQKWATDVWDRGWKVQKKIEKYEADLL